MDFRWEKHAKVSLEWSRMYENYSRCPHCEEEMLDNIAREVLGESHKWRIKKVSSE